MFVAVVIPTVGKHDSTELIHRLESMRIVSCIVLVDQSEGSHLDSVVAAAAPDSKLAYVDDRGHKGLSRARNLGYLKIKAFADVIVFLDDDVLISENALSAGIGNLSGSVKAVTGKVISEWERVAFPGARRVLDAASVWTNSMEPALILNADVMSELGGFDESLGIGSPTIYQSGEGTDLLLRLMAKGHYVLYDPAFNVDESGENLPDGEYCKKAYKYAIGTGRVYSLNYSVVGSLRALPGPLLRGAKALLVGDRDSAWLNIRVAYGRLRGLVNGRNAPRVLGALAES